MRNSELRSRVNRAAAGNAAPRRKRFAAESLLIVSAKAMYKTKDSIRRRNGLLSFPFIRRALT